MHSRMTQVKKKIDSRMRSRIIAHTMTPQYAVETLIGRGWTEASIAEAVGVSQPTIHRIKTGVVPYWDTGAAVISLAKRMRAMRQRQRALSVA